VYSPYRGGGRRRASEEGWLRGGRAVTQSQLTSGRYRPCPGLCRATGRGSAALPPCSPSNAAAREPPATRWAGLRGDGGQTRAGRLQPTLAVCGLWGWTCPLPDQGMFVAMQQLAMAGAGKCRCLRAGVWCPREESTRLCIMPRNLPMLRCSTKRQRGIVAWPFRATHCPSPSSLEHLQGFVLTRAWLAQRSMKWVPVAALLAPDPRSGSLGSSSRSCALGTCQATSVFQQGCVYAGLKPSSCRSRARARCAGESHWASSCRSRCWTWLTSVRDAEATGTRKRSSAKKQAWPSSGRE